MAQLLRSTFRPQSVQGLCRYSRSFTSFSSASTLSRTTSVILFPRQGLMPTRSYCEAASKEEKEAFLKAVAKAPPKDGEPLEIPPQVEKLANDFINLSFFEMTLLLRRISDKLGMDFEAIMNANLGGYAPQQAQQAPQQAQQQQQEAAAEPEAPSLLNVVVASIEGGVKGKFAVMKILRTLQPDLSLQDCKKLLDSMPAILAKDKSPEDANKIMAELKEAGATVELKAA